MADARPLSGGLAGSCKSARQGLGFPASEAGAAPRPYLPPDIVRLIDALVHRLEHEKWLHTMNGGDLGKTLVNAACAGGLLDVRFLIQRADCGHTLISCALCGSIRGVDTILRVCGSVLDECTLNTALYTCAKEGHQEVASRLLAAGADGRSHNSLALRWAAEGGHAPTVAVLLAGGADPDARDGEAIAMARLLGHASTVQVLMEHTQ